VLLVAMLLQSSTVDSTSALSYKKSLDYRMHKTSPSYYYGIVESNQAAAHLVQNLTSQPAKEARGY